MAITLEQLLAWAASGLHVFPLAPRSKKPVAGGHGLNDATTDPEILKRWYAAAPNANYGLNCGKSGLLVVDIDRKPGGPDGAISLAELEIDNGKLPPTMIVSTPSGGRHYYFRGEGGTTASKLGPAIDTRGLGGYVVLPGSEIENGVYILEPASAPPAPLPAWLGELLRPRVKDPAIDTTTPVAALDTPNTILRAMAYLRDEAPPAVEGRGGDATTLRVAMRLKDLGVSPVTAVQLLAEVYNPRCAPAWEVEQLETKVANAYRYGQSAPGSASPEAAGFTAVTVAELPPPKPEELPDGFAVTADTFDAGTLPKRPWILGNELIVGHVTGTVAPGGVGKSMWTMLQAAAVLTGRPLSGDDVHVQGAVWVYNVEDPLDELQRRVLALAQHHGVARDELARMHVSSGRSAPLVIAASGRDGAVVDRKVLERIVGYIRKHNIKLLIVDPFVHTHHCEENSNAEIGLVMHAFNFIAEQGRCAVQIVHHTSKGSGISGDMDKARGASAFGGAVRIMRTIGGMGEDDAGKYGMDDKQRRFYFRVDDAKSNMSPPADKVRWVKKVDVLLPNGDHVGTVEPTTLEAVESEDLQPAIEAVIAAAQAGMWTEGPSPMSEVVEDLLKRDARGDVAVFKGARRKTLGKQLAEAFQGAPLYVPGLGKRIQVFQRGGAWFLELVTAVDFLE